MKDLLIRFIKGIIIGTGFILPGVSGGVLATILGVYERLIRFFANIRKNFMENMRFFIPMGVGVIVSMVLCSALLSHFFETAELQLVWLFIGCVVGTLPSLYKQAGKEGRKPLHIGIMIVVAVVMYLILYYMQSLLSGIHLPLDNLLIWVFAGALMGLGAIVPGLSPSNFLLYLNMYKPMTDHMKNLDVLVILAILVGAALCVVLFSKLVNYMFDHMYAGLFHTILGIILASTLSIVPKISNGIYVNSEGVSAAVGTGGLIACFVTFVAGCVLGWFMSSLEKKYEK